MSHTYNAIQGRFGALNTYLISVQPSEIPEIVGHDPRDMRKTSKNLKPQQQKIRDLYDKVQRVIVKNKVGELRDYVEQYSHDNADGVGALPALSIGVKMPLSFKAYDDFDAINGLIGRLSLPSTPQLAGNALYLDGLKRACAILDCCDPEEGGASIGDVTVAIMVFAPREGQVLSDEDLQQLFFDFNSKATPIGRQLAVTRDTRDLHIQLARTLANSELFTSNGGVDPNGTKLKKGTTHVAVITNLITLVRGAAEGQAGADQARFVSADPNLTSENTEAFKNEILCFLKGFVEGLTPPKFRDREDHFHLQAPGWWALGVLFHELHVREKITGQSLAEYGRRVGQLGWKNDNPIWAQLRAQKQNRRGVLEYGWTVAGSHVPGREILKVLRRELCLASGNTGAVAAE